MSSNILSRFLPPTDSLSVYEAIREHDAGSDSSDLEERAGLALGMNHEDDLNESERIAHLVDAARSGDYSPKVGVSGPQSRGHGAVRRGSSSRARWRMHTKSQSPNPRSEFRYESEDRDGDVPLSLLVEGLDEEGLRSRLPPPPHSMPSQPRTPSPATSPLPNQAHEPTRQNPPIPGAISALPLARWFVAQQHPGLSATDPKQKAMWRWANVENLDNFLKDVYTYFLGNGVWSILLSRTLNLLTFAFVVGFTTFLTNCIDYHKVRGSKSLDEILVPKCVSRMSGSATLLLWLLSFFWISKFFQLLLDVRRLKHMHDFYHYLLGISDPEVQTISWQEVVSRLMTLRDANPATAAAISAKHRKYLRSQSKQRMDAHDIANRLMRKENYMIALVNKDIMDLTLPIPFLRNRPLFSRTLEWNLNLCIMDYVFNEQGQLRTIFLKDTHRRALSDGLRRRFIFAGIMNIFVAPFIVVYFLMHYFFRYFNEFKKNPSQIGSRQYTPLAEWKFREFNELWHLFERRTNMSYPFASRYIDQFPKDKTVQLARFVAFVSGALASVLALASVIDPELFLGFEITPDRTVLFYLGIFGTVWAFAQGMAPEETDVFDPEFALLELIDFTHYCPSSWKGRLHSDDVRKEFAVCYQLKIVIFLEEILSMIFTPFVLWFSLPKCSDRLIDFFREFTVHVDGVGYLCSFAVFDFKKGTNVGTPGRPDDHGRRDLRADYFSAKDGKMLASYYGFLDNYGNNPQPGNRRPFHPPPGLPTLGSPVITATPARFDQATRLGPAGGLWGPQSVMAASRNRQTLPADPSQSPGPSILLDPHHQPSHYGFRSTARHPPHQRSRAARSQLPLSRALEDEDSDPAEPRQSSSRPSQGGMSGPAGLGESSLGESWRMNPLGPEDEAVAEDDDENLDAITGGGGVLGLIQQFQKANAESRRPPVGI
ncbi:Autophagy-related protein 9 [Penicillium ucsense]|uniref:Autophagy-related protein 9 n=1 Tax=Penicillium ucsense TaxID=2839758 RepID=A0A8J8VXH6_9EURO|nr:Autophagy-related protein 9 [Penicillium ucsense]KAF7730751.1 Autophagy-related protein 9 [Penicillium ucsense]